MGYVDWIPTLPSWRKINISLVTSGRNEVAECIVTTQTNGLRHSESDSAIYRTPPNSPADLTRSSSWMDGCPELEDDSHLNSDHGLEPSEIDSSEYRSCASFFSISEAGASPKAQQKVDNRAQPDKGLEGYVVNAALQKPENTTGAGCLTRMTRSMSNTLLAAGTGLILSAGRSAARTGAQYLRSDDVVVASAPSQISVLVYHTNGKIDPINIESTTSIPGLMQIVERKCGLSAQRQCLSIEEGRNRSGNLLQLAQQTYQRLTCQTNDAQRTVWSTMSFLILPEAFNREIGGRGLVSWLRTSEWYQGFLENNKSAKGLLSAGSSSRPTCKVLIEHLNGQVRVISADATCSIQDLKAAIQQDFGIAISQQRFVIKEKAPPGSLTTASYHVTSYLQSCLKTSLAFANTASGYVRSNLPKEFLVSIRTNNGKKHQVTVNGNTTINELRRMVETDQEFIRVQQIEFPPGLPSAAAGPKMSDVIQSVLV